MRKDQRRIQKQKKREKRNKADLTRDKAASLRRQKLQKYPSFVLGRQDADPEFIAAIMHAVKRYDFLDTKALGAGFQAFLKLGKKVGFAEAFRILNEVPSINYGGRELTHETKLVVANANLGNQLLSLVPKEVRETFIPYNDVSVEPTQHEIRLNFSSMKSVSGTGGRVYYSRHEPLIEFDKKAYVVAFSRHAVDRICKRVNPRYIEYGPAGDIHALFSTCVYFEPVILHGGQPAFALYDVCGNKGFSHYSTYTVGVFGEENIKPGAGTLYYRIGYCPVVLENSFAKAKTFEPPGFRGTPEYGLVLNSDLPPVEKRKMLQRISDDSGNELQRLINNDNEITKWFHNNGLPQVFQWSHEVFRPFGY